MDSKTPVNETGETGKKRGDYYESPHGLMGTSKYHRSSTFFPSIVHTDGIVEMCEELQCYWLVDVICSYLPKITRHHKVAPPYYMKFIRTDDGGGVFTIEDYMENVFVKQVLEYTDITKDVKCKLGYSALGNENYYIICLFEED